MTMQQKFRAARLMLGLSQQRLADRIGCSRPAVAQYEAGKKCLSPDRARIGIDWMASCLKRRIEARNAP